MKKILAPLTAVSIALGVSALAAVPANADDDDINYAIKAEAPFLKAGLTCASTPADIMLPASPVITPSAGVTDVPLEYLAPVWTEAGFAVVVNVLPEFQRYYDVWGNGVQVRAETVTFIIPACPPVVTDPVVVPPVTAEPVIIPPVVAEPVPNTPLPVLVPSGERAPLDNVTPAVVPNTVESTPVAADPVPALQPAASTEVPAEQYAVATSTDELAQTGAKEDVALFAVLALAAGVALMVLRRKLA